MKKINNSIFSSSSIINEEVFFDYGSGSKKGKKIFEMPSIYLFDNNKTAAAAVTRAAIIP